MLRAAGLLLLAAAAAADPADLLFRARHAEKVQGDPRRAIDLYREALGDTSLGARDQAEVHLRLAACLERVGEHAQALAHLAESVYAHEEVPADLRRAADVARARVQEKLPQRAEPAPAPAVDSAAERKRIAARYLREARARAGAGDHAGALYRAQLALSLDPDNEEARALSEEIETRMGETARLVQNFLPLLRSWTEARTRVVANEARRLVAEAAEHGRRGDVARAEDAYRRAVRAIQECEFGEEADELIELQQRAQAQWRQLRARHGVTGGDGPEADRQPPARGAVVADFLNLLQHMLDLASGSEREYRILPLQVRPGIEPGKWQAKPERFRLRRNEQPSSWTAARFARRWLADTVHPGSWEEPGNLIEAAGPMLLVRNRPPVLDALQDAVKRLERPDPAPLRTRFLLASVPAGALAALAEALSPRTGDPASLLCLRAPPELGLERVCGLLADAGADVSVARDVFAVDLANGAGQTLAMSSVAGGEGLLLLDVHPLREAGGRTSLGFRVVSRFPAPAVALAAGDGRPPLSLRRDLVQEGEAFADLEPGAVLVVAGLVDPFAAAEGDLSAERVLLLLWENPPAPGIVDADPAAPEATVEVARDVEIAVGDLLLDVRDDPGPESAEDSGFAPRDPLAVLAARATFLEMLFRDALDSRQAAVDLENGVLRVPRERRVDAAEVLASLERQSSQAYIVRVRVRAVGTGVIQRWMQREGLAPQAFGAAYVAYSDESSGEFLLRNLAAEPPDVFAPAEELPALAALGLQARHVLSARALTYSAYAHVDELRSGPVRVVREGLRVTVRPYEWRGSLHAHVEIETAVAEAEEELALAVGIPSHRIRVKSGTVSGRLDLGTRGAPSTAVVGGLPHPTLTGQDRLVELLLAVSVRPAQ